jgi:hypothetical protein
VAGVGGSQPYIYSELLVVISRVLVDCRTPFPYNTAGIVARELLHHFDVEEKP